MKLRQLSLALMFLSGLAASGVATAGDADFTLVNRTGYTLREIYISPSKKANWGTDRLGQNNLDNNKQRLFKFGDKGACVQDLKVVFDDDNSESVWEGFNLCEVEKITIRYNRKTDTVSADTE